MSDPHVARSAGAFTGIGQIALTVDDLARARDFYQNTLGLPFLFEAGQLAFLQCGEVRLMLSTSENAGPRGGTVIYYKVGDMQAAHAALVKRGVSFLQDPHVIARMPDHDLWMAFIRDTEANTIGIMCEVRN